MGRTLPTQIQLLREAENSWKFYRRALRKEDQRAFDVVWSHARKHAAASSMAARSLPFEAHLLSMVIGLQRDLDSLRETILARTEFREKNDHGEPSRGSSGCSSFLPKA